MSKTFLSTDYILILISSVIILSSFSSSATVPSQTLYVDDDNIIGPWDGSIDHPYQTIQQAIDEADAYDAIMVSSGVYQEHLIIAKPLTLIGESAENTIISGNYSSTILTITSSSTSIQQFHITQSGSHTHEYGIEITTSFVTIDDCIFSYTKTGIAVFSSTDIHISDCELYTNGGGILFDQVTHSRIVDCRLDHNAVGIHIEQCSSIELMSSSVFTSGVGVHVNNSEDISIGFCAIANNNDNRGGLFLFNNNDIDVYECHIRHNGVGLRSSYNHDLTISSCDFLWNTHFAMGIWEDSYDVLVTESSIRSNLRYGIHVDGHSDAEVRFCTFSNNTLQAIFCEEAVCDAGNNWWQTPLGPSRFDLPWMSWVSRPVKIYPVHYFTPAPVTGCSWEYDQTVVPVYRPFERQQPLPLDGVDDDQDGVPNWWEQTFGFDMHEWENHSQLDPDGDGLNNLEECYAFQWGAHPYTPDVFLEIDWVQPSIPDKHNKPSDARIEELEQIFLDQGIVLHVDRGELGGGQMIPYISGFTYPVLRDLYWEYFLDNDMNNPRKGIFHYGLICDEGPGAGFMFMGWDHLDSFCISADILQENQPQWSRDQLIVGGSVHELGHTLGLTVDDHGGNDNRGAIEFLSRQWWLYRNYYSCMNYFYSYKLLSYSDGTHGPGDFDDWGNLEFTFFKNTHLDWPAVQK